LYRGTSEIDALVYALYGLTEEEIEIVERASGQQGVSVLDRECDEWECCPPGK
jgi:hypothetical protein